MVEFGVTSDWREREMFIFTVQFLQRSHRPVSVRAHDASGRTWSWNFPFNTKNIGKTLPGHLRSWHEHWSIRKLCNMDTQDMNFLGRFTNFLQPLDESFDLSSESAFGAMFGMKWNLTMQSCLHPDPKLYPNTVQYGVTNWIHWIVLLALYDSPRSRSQETTYRTWLVSQPFSTSWTAHILGPEDEDTILQCVHHFHEHHIIVTIGSSICDFGRNFHQVVVIWADDEVA